MDYVLILVLKLLGIYICWVSAFGLLWSEMLKGRGTYVDDGEE